ACGGQDRCWSQPGADLLRVHLPGACADSSGRGCHCRLAAQPIKRAPVGSPWACARRSNGAVWKKRCDPERSAYGVQLIESMNAGGAGKAIPLVATTFTPAIEPGLT